MWAIGLILCVLAGLIPSLIYAGFVNWLDRHEKEPRGLLILVFFWGMVPALIAAIVTQSVLDIPTSWILAEGSLASELVGSSLWAPLTEELAKGLGVFFVLVLAHREIDSLLDGIIYGAMAGLGFAFSENLLYFGAALAEEGWGGWVFVVLLRTIPFGLNHALFTGLVGAGLGAAALSAQTGIKLLAPLAGLAAGIAAHGIHNLGASLTHISCLTLCGSFLFDWAAILMLGGLIAFVWRQEKSWMVGHLPGEVNDETYQLLTSWADWRRARWQSLARADLSAWRRLSRLRQVSTELAFKKRRLALQGPDPQTEREIERYRGELIELDVALSPPPA